MVEGGAVLPNDDTEIMLLLSSTRRAISHHVKRTFSSHQLKNIIEVESAYREEDDDMSEANSLDYDSEMESDGDQPYHQMMIQSSVKFCSCYVKDRLDFNKIL